MEKYNIFLSHFSNEGSVANLIKDFIEEIFARAIDVFVTSNEWSLRPGDEWELKIRSMLLKSEMIFVLLSMDSIIRPWVNFEAGAAWVGDKILIPILHRGYNPKNLERPYSSAQTVSLIIPEDIRKLINRIKKETNLNPLYRHEDIINFTHKAQVLGNEIDEKSALLMKTKKPRDRVRFYLYTKSQMQYIQNERETYGKSLSCFSKPDVFEVFNTLTVFGHPETLIISLDEYWIKELAKNKKLEDLTNFIKDNKFHENLLTSGKLNNKNWSVPHFLDFSYYLIRTQGLDILKSWFDKLFDVEDKIDYINNLKNVVASENLLLYDFHTPDTCACLILEFIESFGNGVCSLDSYDTIIHDNNVLALKILRSMVGDRPEHDFLLGDPINFDNFTSPFLRCWYSRMIDMPESRINYTPILNSPMKCCLGGWNVGILFNSPYTSEAIACLTNLVSKENQQQRFEQCAGLPTRNEFYTLSDLARQTDILTHLSLSDIGKYINKLIKRSDIKNYSSIRIELCNLHDMIMKKPMCDLEDIFLKWAEKFKT